MRKKLFFFNWALSEENLSILRNHLLHEINLNSQIIILQCKGYLKPCFFNAESARANCWSCVFNSSSVIQEFKNQVSVVKLPDLKKSIINYEFNYSTVDDLKSIVYKDVYVGYAALSNYATNTRNQSPDFSQEKFRIHFDNLLNASARFTDFLHDYLSKNNVDEIILFNGRTNDSRPLFDLALNKGIKLTVLEGNMVNARLRKNTFENCLPQNIQFVNGRILSTWENTNLPISKKIVLGEKFFHNRKNGVLAADVKVFVKDQILGQLPDNIHEKKNIVIFNSSEDEFAAIGKDWDDLCLFSNQIEGIKFICENASSDYNIFLRIHPNLKGITYKHHTDLIYLKNEYSNLTIIPSESSISTYSLMDHADKVVVFGSTTGAEACYWGKPVILLGGCFYYYLNISFNPKTRDELSHLINENLLAKDNLNAIKYGFYLLHPEFYTNPVDGNTKSIMLFGKKIITFHDSITLQGSKYLHVAISLIIKCIGFFDKRVLKKHKVIPK